jgi:surfactin synthase thioesterase subunit
MNDNNPALLSKASEIAFGLDRATDERSLILFMERFARPALLATLVPRLDDQEIVALLDHLGGLMKKHLREPEYHRLFLKDR